MVDNVKIELTPKQTAAIRSLLTQPSIAAAALDVGVTPKTIYIWLNQTEFRTELTKAEDQALDTATRGLVGMTEKALGVLATVLDDPLLHPATRLRAAEVVLSNLLRLVELRSLAARVAALERAPNA